MQRLKKVKLEFFYFRKAVFEYKHGFRYLTSKYRLAERILKNQTAIDRPINNKNLSIHVLTCHKDMIMMLWSLASYYQVVETIGQLYLHNDGSLTVRDLGVIRRLLPNAIIIESEKFKDNYADELSRYPVIKRFRENYPQFFSFKKIVDPYFVSDRKIRLIFDTDILWFKRPVELEDEISRLCPHSYMQANNVKIEVTFNDGTSLDENLAGYNAGIILYSTENFSLQKFSSFLEKLDVSRERNLHFADQAGHAYALSKLQTLPAARYSIRKAIDSETTAKHFTSPRRPLFYTEGVFSLADTILEN
jgi:hypothetical protein